MIRSSLPSDERKRVIMMPLEDSAYNTDQWIESVHTAVDDAWQGIRGSDWTPQPDWHPKVSLIGHAKDATSYYLNLFPSWDSINVPQTHVLDATTMRGQLFGDHALVESYLMANPVGKDNPTLKYLKDYAGIAQTRARDFLKAERAELKTCTSDLPAGVIDYLSEFVEGDHYREITDEFAFVALYKEQWKAAPYPPIFSTVDAVVIHAGHVLMVKRGGFPGKGLWALPGGFLNPNEFIVDAMIRELREETGLRVPAGLLKGALEDVRVFDDPYRSSRGRTITHAHLIHLPPGPQPKVRGADDAVKAEWIPLARLRRDKCFEDHFAIINAMVGSLRK